MSVLDRMPDVELEALTQIVARENLVLAQDLQIHGQLTAEPLSPSFKAIVTELRLRGVHVTTPVENYVIRPLSVLMLNDSPIGVYIHREDVPQNDLSKAAEQYRKEHPEHRAERVHARGPFKLGAPARL